MRRSPLPPLNAVRAFEAAARHCSFKGAADVAGIMSSLAGLMGYSFENNGVQATLSNPYLHGTAYRQAEKCAHDADINWTLDNGKLAIWPKGKARAGDTPLISKDTGMVGYPGYNKQGIMVTTLFNPAIVYGSMIQVQSSLTPACGKWIVYTLVHDLASETTDGPWFTQMLAGAPGYTPVV